MSNDPTTMAQALRAADAALSPDAPTLHRWAAEELEERGAPHAGWPGHALLLAFHGLVALPDAARFAADVVDLLRLMAPHPHLSGLASAALRDYLMPGDRWAVPPILDALRGHGPMAPEPAVQALAAIGDPGVVAPLLEVVAHPRHPVAASAALVLGRLGAQEAAAPLLALLGRRRDPEVVTALGLLRVPQAAPVVRALLDAAGAVRPGRRRERDAEMLAAAAHALGRLADAGAVPALRALLDDGDAAVAIAAADALTRLGDARGVDVLRAHAHEWEAARRLAQLDPDGGAAAMRACWRVDPHLRPRGMARDAGGRQRLLRALGHAGDADDLPFLAWVVAHDADRTEQGWTLAEEARRAARRIEARRALARDAPWVVGHVTHASH